MSKVPFFGIVSRFMADTNKQTNEIDVTLERLHDHIDDRGVGDLTAVRTLMRDRLRETLGKTPLNDAHYEQLGEQLNEAHRRLRADLTVEQTKDPKSAKTAELKKQVEDATAARRLAAELRFTLSDRAKAHHEHHAAEDSAKFKQEISPLGAPFRFLKRRLWDNAVKGKGEGWNPLTWPSKSVQYVYKSIPEHKLAAVVGAGVGTVIVGFPLGTALGTAAFSTTAKFLKENMKAESSGGHGAAH